MTLQASVEQQITQLASAAGSMPATLQANDSQGLCLRIELSAVDSMSCALLELSLFVPSLQNAVFDSVKQWAEQLSQRITYLLEQVGPLEFDEAAGQALIRSTPPQHLAQGTQYYEMILSSTGAGSFSLKRFASVAGQPGRTPVEMRMTHEVLYRLIEDLVATIPGTP